ncbi:MAG: 2-C-methyl-D-erythritol 2,4-cyclodiphosphate synthase [Prevotella sp.]|nr:2-C-methyl-D-erythritol 2,4-cyclodiphosphate synthase [Prevotella sp.]
MRNNRFETTDALTYQLLLDKAREMRKNPTEAESVMWSYLSDNKMGVHFRRQHPVCGYIPDFVSLKERLIIEIDGGYHFEGEQPEMDAERTQYLNQEGFVVLRFTNEEVLGDIDNVLEEISDALEDCERTNQTPLPFGRGMGVGFGYDVHRLVPDRELWMGGIRLDYELGLLGHSDADVLIHAVCDAILGAANMRDIGYHFPDTSAETEGMDSKVILRKTIELIATKGYRLVNIDATICAERPKMNPHIPSMQQCMAEVIGCDPDCVSIKATTTERLGFTGRQEGISAYAVALIARG